MKSLFLLAIIFIFTCAAFPTANNNNNDDETSQLFIEKSRQKWQSVVGDINGKNFYIKLLVYIT